MPLPVRVHPENPHLFEFRGKPLVLVTACEHYGGVMNRPFRFERYLTDTAEVGINYTRLFMLFRELQSAANPYSTCKPESTDYIAPFERVGRERALDLQPKYDLDRWNPEFVDRLHREASNPLDVHQFSARSFGGMDFDAVNMHPLSNMKHAGETYDLGRFMHAQIHLRAAGLLSGAHPGVLPSSSAFFLRSGWVG